MSTGLPLWARCQASIFSCSVSRNFRSSAFFGASFLMMAASPAQNASGEIPVLGAASLAMKSNRTGAIFNPWASTRFMRELSRQEMAFCGCFRGENSKKRAKRGGVQGALLATSRDDEKAPKSRKKPWGDASNIGGKISQFVEQDAAPGQHPLDLLRCLRHRVGRGIEHQFSLRRRLV